MHPTPDRFTMSEAQYNKLLDEMTGIKLGVAETKGAIGAFASGLAEEREARLALKLELDKHDVMLRGDGARAKGLRELVDDAVDRSDRTDKELAGLKKIMIGTAVGVGTPVAIYVLTSVLKLAYGGS